HEEEYFPGEANLRMADIVVINKMDSATEEGIEAVKKNVKRIAPDALIVEADSELTVNGGDISGKKVLVVEDGPTLTHGEMKYGAAAIAAERNGAEMVEPRDKAVGKIAETYEKYPYIGKGILPAMGYGEEQKKDLEKTINSIEADFVLSGTPIDLKRVVNSNKPIVSVGYELKPRSGFESVIEKAIKEKLFG
ncbi:MAG: GTPase, partial [bacterium]